MIGRAQSADCIRLANWNGDAVRLRRLFRPSASVEDG